MKNFKAEAQELKSQIAPVVTHPAYHAIATVGDTEIMCYDCQKSVSDIIPQVQFLQKIIKDFEKVWDKKGWITEDGFALPVYGEGNQPIYKYFWNESYNSVKESGLFTQTYDDICAEIKRNASNSNGYLSKPEWKLAYNKIKERNKQIFVEAVKAKTAERMKAANAYMTDNYYGPLMLIKALWESRSKPIVAYKDQDGTLFCPICGNYEVRAVGTSIPRGKAFTQDDDYDKIYGFNQSKSVEEVKYFYTDEEGTMFNIIDNLEGEPWENVEAASQEHIDDYNEAIEIDIALAQFYEIAPYMSIGQVCKKLGKRADLIADEIADYYECKM